MKFLEVAYIEKDPGAIALVFSLWIVAFQVFKERWWKQSQSEEITSS